MNRNTDSEVILPAKNRIPEDFAVSKYAVAPTSNDVLAVLRAGELTSAFAFLIKP